MSIDKYWYLRSPRDLCNAHYAKPPTAKYGTVESVCGATFQPVALFTFGTASAEQPFDPRVCPICQATVLPSQRTS
jgi:hypothetical protein